MPHLSDAKIKEAIYAKDGNVTDIAAALGIHRSTVYRRVEKSPDLQTAMSEAGDILLDVAVSHVTRKVRAGEEWALAYYLNNSPAARRHGWGKQAVEVTGANGGPLRIKAFVGVSPDDWDEGGADGGTGG